MLRLKKQIKRCVAAVLIALALAVSLYLYFANKNTVQAYSEMTVLSPVVSWQTADNKNMYCVGDVTKYICKDRYEWDYPVMIAIATCESRLNPEAIKLEPNGSWSGGLLQINSVHSYAPSQVFNPEKNVELAYNVWLSQGYGAWSVYKTDCYYNEYKKLIAMDY